MRHHNGDVWVNGWRQVCKGAGQLPRAVTTSPEPAPAVPRDELAGMLRPFVSSGSDEWEMADELLAYLDIRLRTEGSDT